MTKELSEEGAPGSCGADLEEHLPTSPRQDLPLLGKPPRDLLVAVSALLDASALQDPGEQPSIWGTGGIQALQLGLCVPALGVPSSSLAETQLLVNQVGGGPGGGPPKATVFLPAHRVMCPPGEDGLLVVTFVSSLLAGCSQPQGALVTGRCWRSSTLHLIPEPGNGGQRGRDSPMFLEQGSARTLGLKREAGGPPV